MNNNDNFVQIQNNDLKITQYVAFEFSHFSQIFV